MKLSVPTPPGWSRRTVAGGELLQSPEGSRELLVHPIEGVKLSPAQWLYAALVHQLPPGIEPQEVVHGQLKTATGWTAVTVDAVIGGRSRVVVYFTFLDQAATVIATASTPDARAWCDEVIAILYYAAPDFSGGRVSGLGELLGQAPPTTLVNPGPLDESWHRGFSGGNAVFTSKPHPDSGWIRCSPAQVPVRPAAQLLSEMDGPPEIGITAEGEYFALATKQAEPVSRAMAIVYGAESYTRIDAAILEPEQLDAYVHAVRTLAFETSLGYGVGRVRPFYYEPPEKWIALPRPGSTVWISPACAWRYHVLRVYDARPRDRHKLTQVRRFETLAPEFLARPERGPAVFWTPRELECRVSAHSGAFGGGELSILDGGVLDERYVYPLRIECDPELFDESMQLFEDVAHSIVPLPSPVAEGMEPSQAVALYAIWAD